MFGRKARRIRELEAELESERRLDSKFLARVQQLENQVRNEGAGAAAQSWRTDDLSSPRRKQRRWERL